MQIYDYESINGERFTAQTSEEKASMSVVLFKAQLLQKNVCNMRYSGFQNCPNVCMFSKDLGIVAQ